MKEYSGAMSDEEIAADRWVNEGGKFVVIAHGSPGEVSKTQEAFAATRHQGVKEHACCA